MQMHVPVEQLSAAATCSWTGAVIAAIRARRIKLSL
jgi:hypothetical protein